MRHDPDNFFAHMLLAFKERLRFICGSCHHVVTRIIYYTGEMICGVLLNRIAGDDICKETLITDGMQEKLIAEVIAIIESREIAHNANPSSSLSAMSAYRRACQNGQGSTQSATTRSQSPSLADRARTSLCPGCGSSFHIFSRMFQGWNKRPLTL